MPIPDFQGFFAPMLQFASDGCEHTNPEMRAKIADHFKFTPEELEQKLPSGTQTVVANRVAWTSVYLTRAGAFKKLRRGVFQITDRGLTLLKKYPLHFGIKQLSEFPEFVAFHKGKAVDEKQVTEVEEAITPEEKLADAYQELRNALANDVLETVRKTQPSFFERLVVELLVAMGYGGSIEDAGRAVGGSGDGGIDGIIKEDKLGLDVVYIQAKRWKDSVGRPVVQAFAGSLEGVRARKGVLITTSVFTQDALEYVQKIEKKIVLIDGKQLADLMIDHNVGVAPTQTYTLKQLDSDYFETV